MIDLDNLRNLRTNELLEQCLKTKNKNDVFEILNLVETRKRLSDLTLIKKLVNHVISLEGNIQPKDIARKDPPPLALAYNRTSKKQWWRLYGRIQRFQLA